MMTTGEEIKLIEKKTKIKLDYTNIKENRYKLNGNICPFLSFLSNENDSECSIYDIRPCQCRIYHCGRIKPTDRKLNTISEIQELMERDPIYREFKTKMDEEAIIWGNVHGWNWKKYI